MEAILTTTGQLTVAALAGNAAAGGLMLALAADEVWCRSGAVLNPHYRLMGLHGSEYWTYTLPRRVGAEQAARLTGACLPVSPASALRCGLVDRVIERRRRRVPRAGSRPGREAGPPPRLPARLAAKARRLAEVATTQPLDSLPPGRTRRDEPELLRTRASRTPSCAAPLSTSRSRRGHRPTSPATGPAPAAPSPGGRSRPSRLPSAYVDRLTVVSIS